MKILICLVCPTFLSLLIYYSKLIKNKIIKSKICFYILGNLLVNIGTLLSAYLFFQVSELRFKDTSFTVKYLILATSLSIAFAFLVGIIPKAKKYFTNLYKSGCRKGKFDRKLFYKKNKALVEHAIFIGTSLLLFYLLDWAARRVAINIGGYSRLLQFSANVFTFTYCFIFLFLMYVLPKIPARIYAILTYILSIVLYIVNYMLLKIKGEALRISELNNTSEGAKYLNFIMDKITFIFIMVIILSIVLAIINFVFMNKAKNNKIIKLNYKKVTIALIIIVVGLFGTPKTLAAPEDGWLFISSPKYYYDTPIDSPKSLAICGLYQYTTRDIYFYYKNKISLYGSEDEIQTLMRKYESSYEENDYSGKFKDKNLIMIMMESIDNVSITEETMPTLSKMMREGWNFKSRYSVLNTGGSTIATEFISMTGLYFDNYFYSYMYNNKYSNSIPNVFRNNGYRTASVHENFGKYYSRDVLHKNMGFNNSYFLYEYLNDYQEYMDKQIVENDKVYSNIISKDEKFMDFIITMAAHGPYDNTNKVCNEELGTHHDDLECLNMLAKRTDDMLASLLRRLEEDGLLDDTVIVLYTDHQAYGYNYTQEYLDSLKAIDEEKNIKAIPFVIYSSTEEAKEFEELIVNDIDIVPTIFNLFGIEYNPSDYLGRDIFAKDHTNLLLLSNGTWYDGNIYSNNSEVDKTTEDYNKNNEYTQDKFELNKMILSNNYYEENKN